jgi:hypothetical protein
MLNVLAPGRFCDNTISKHRRVTRRFSRSADSFVRVLIVSHGLRADKAVALSKPSSNVINSFPSPRSEARGEGDQPPVFSRIQDLFYKATRLSALLWLRLRRAGRFVLFAACI